MVDQLSVVYQLLGCAVCVCAIPLYTFLTCTQVITLQAYVWFVPLALIVWLTLCAGAVVIQIIFFRTRPPREVLLHRTGHESRNPDSYLTRF